MNRVTKLCVPGMIALLALAAGCASSPSGGDDDTAPRNVITMEQLDQDPTLSAWDVIRKLKPRWLQRRGVGSMRSQTQLLVLVDNSQTNDLGVLESLRANTIREIRYLDARTATMRYGTRASGGAILVFSR